MKRLLLPLPLLLFLAGCPEGKPTGTTDTSPVGTPTVPAAVTSTVTWASVAENVAVRLDEVVKAIDAGNKQAALKAFDAAYFLDYEGEAHNLEVACRQLDPEVDDRDSGVNVTGKKRPVVMLREERWGEIKAAIKSGAPSQKVRELVDALVAKIRDDARKLDTR